MAVSGDITLEEHCKDLVQNGVREFGGIDILVNNAAFQRTYADISHISAQGVGPNFQDEHIRPGHPREGCDSSHAARQLDHQHDVRPIPTALPPSSGICIDERGDLQLYRWSCGNGR